MGWHCPTCWAEWGEGAVRCFVCDARPDERKDSFAERLIAGLRPDDPSVAQHAARILAEMGEKPAVPQLISLLQASSHEFVLEAVATALGRIGDSRAIAPLCVIVRNGPRAAREAAAAALARLDARAALPVLDQVVSSLGREGLRALKHLRGEGPQPAVREPETRAHRPPLGGDPCALLRERSRFPGCPVCGLVSEDLSGFISQWQYLSTVQQVVRQRFRAHGGFCAEHLRLLGQVASPQGLDVSLPEVLARQADIIRGLKSQPSCCGGPAEAGALVAQERACQACAVCFGAESRYIEAIGALLEDDSFRHSYAASIGLCAPHFLCLQQQLRDEEHRRWLREAQGAYLRRLAETMQSHLRKHQQQLRHEMTVQEQQAARRALAVIAGDPLVRPGITQRLSARANRAIP